MLSISLLPVEHDPIEALRDAARCALSGRILSAGGTSQATIEHQAIAATQTRWIAPFSWVDDIVILSECGDALVMTTLKTAADRNPHRDFSAAALNLGLHGIHRAPDGDVFIRLS